MSVIIFNNSTCLGDQYIFFVSFSFPTFCFTFSMNKTSI